jgi:hypothetical protein
MVWNSVNGIYEEPADSGQRMAMMVEDPLEPGTGHIESLDETESSLWLVWINALLYINSVSADIREEWLISEKAAKIKGKKGKARRIVKQRIKDGGKVFRVGHYIHIPQVGDSEKKPHQGGKVSVRFLVRGHWHKFWVGSNRFGNRKQVIKWLAPYWKGPETADVVHGTYVVDKTKKKESK